VNCFLTTWQLENYCEGEQGVKRDNHGNAGPLKVSHGGGFKGHQAEVDKWLKASAMAGMEVVPDAQDFETTNGISVSHRWSVIIFTAELLFRENIIAGNLERHPTNSI
jgi:hypothetical protein